MPPFPPPTERFQLRELIGEGGAGLVVRADDRLTGEAVAIKFILGGERTDWQIQALLREMRMVAGLSHPNIVGLIDAGHQVETLQTADGTALPPGPWLAMELARCSLQATPPSDPRKLTATARVLLDALGHAHARGVLHLDVKPTNLLLDDDGQLLLTDFGLGLAGDAEVISGATDGWSAPEVLAGEVALTGPWSDLYSVGRVLESWLPAVLRGREVPGDLRAVLDALLHEDPSARFRSAPAAWSALAASLESLPKEGGEERGEATLAPSPPSSAGTLPITSPVVSLSSAARRRSAPSSPSLAQPVLSCGPEVLAQAPGPLDEVGAMAEDLAPPGLGLAGLRAGRMVGRRREREALAREGDAILSGSRAGALLLRGPSGVGLSRLASWTAERVLEHAGGTALHLGGSGLDAVTLADALRRAFRLRASDPPAAARQQLDRALARLDVHSRFARSTLLSWLVSSDGPPPSLHMLADALDELFHAMLSDGPLVLIFDPIDDGFPDAELIMLLQRRLTSKASLMLLVLPDGGEGSPVEGGVAALPGVPVVTVDVPLMPDGDLARVIRGRIAADDALIHELVRASSGRPRDTMLLLEHLVRQKALLPAPGGYRPAGGLERHLPSSLGHIEVQRTLDLVRGLPRDDRRELVLRALLDAAPEALRHRALAQIGLGDAVTRLLSAGLLSDRDGRVRVSTMALRRQLLLLGALQEDVHALLPHALSVVERANIELGEINPAVKEELCAELLVRAGEHRLAAEGLLRAAWCWTTLAAPAWALRLLEDAERSLDDADETEEDPLRAEIAGVRAMALHQSGRSAAGLASLRSVESSVSRRVALARASCLLALGRADEAVEVAWSLVRDAGEELARERAEGLLLLGRCLIVAGQFDAALPVLGEAHELASSSGDSETEDRALAFTCHALSALDEHDRCREVGDAALSVARAGGRLWAIAQLTQPLGDVAFRQGRPDEAIAYYMEGLEVLPYRSPIAAVTWANIARVQNDLGQFEAADQAARNGLQHLSGGSHNRVMQLVQSARLPKLVTRGPEGELGRVLDAMLAFSRTSQATFREVAEQAEIAWQHAVMLGSAAAPSLLDLATASWERLGDVERASRLRSGGVQV